MLNIFNSEKKTKHEHSKNTKDEKKHLIIPNKQQKTEKPNQPTHLWWIPCLGIHIFLSLVAFVLTIPGETRETGGETRESPGGFTRLSATQALLFGLLLANHLCLLGWT